MMRFAIVSYCGAPWGGSEIFWTALAERLIKEGHEVLVSVFDWEDQHPQVKALKKLGVLFVYRRKFYPGIIQRVRKKVLNAVLPEGKKKTYHDYLIRFSPNHILFNLAGGNEMAFDTEDMMILVRQLNIPFSVFYHSLTRDAVFTNEQLENFKFVFNKSRNSLFTSRMQIDLFQQQVGIKIKHALIVRHPLRDISIPSLEEGIRIPVHMCIIGSLVTRWKGQDMAIEVLSSPMWRERKWVLNIYGAGDDLEKLRKMVAAAGISDKVVFHGYQGNIQEILGSNSIVLIPSRQDSGPIVLFEAMLAERPVVGTPMGSMPEFIVSGENGVIADEISVEAYAKALEFAWSNMNSWREWGINGRRKVQREYESDSVGQFLDLIGKQ